MNSPKTSNKSIKKEWKDLSPKEKKETIAVLLTIGLFVLVWVSSGFRSAVGIVLLAWSIYYLVKIFRVKDRQKRIKTSIVAFSLLVISYLVMPMSDQYDDQSTNKGTDKQTQVRPDKDTSARKEQSEGKAESNQVAESEQSDPQKTNIVVKVEKSLSDMDPELRQMLASTSPGGLQGDIEKVEEDYGNGVKIYVSTNYREAGDGSDGGLTIARKLFNNICIDVPELESLYVSSTTSGLDSRSVYKSQTQHCK